MSNRLDRQDATGRAFYMPGRGHMFGWPTHLGADANATTGVPIDGIAGFAPSAIFFNWLGGAGTTLYVNVGTFASAKWYNIDSLNDGALVSLTAATTLTALVHGHRTLLLNASGGFTTTLPAATGAGMIYKFTVGTVSTTGYVVSTAPTTDIFQGSIAIGIDASATGKAFKTAANSNTITFNGTTQGGVTIGDTFWVQDIASGVWAVIGTVIGSGSIATPFSHV